MTGRFTRQRTILTILLLLTGCAALAPLPGDNTAQTVPGQAAPARAYFHTIDLGGRLSVRYQNHGKEETLYGSFIWLQDPAQTRITLLSPLGQTIAAIDVTPEGSTLRQGGQTVRSAADVDTLVAQTLGWPLPVAGLRNWLQGFGVDVAGQPFVAAPQKPEVTTRDDWHIRYVNWQDDTSSASPVRPRRVDLDRTTAQAGDVVIRIVLDTWQPR
jgi:outer membrane lipoprotein LolB